MRRFAPPALLGCFFSLITAGSSLWAQDDSPPVSLRGIVDLEPPEGAANQDASGMAHLRQVEERAAIHVLVRNLEPGATYDVQIARDDTTESLGTITTHSGEVPPPSYFGARLTSATCEQVEQPPPEEEPGDDVDRDWRDRLQDFMDRIHHHHHSSTDCPRGYVSFAANAERTELHYYIHVRGLAEPVTEASLQLGDESIPLDVEELAGTLEVTEEQLAAMAAGTASVTLLAGEEVLEGAVVARFQELRERIAEHHAGRGALRLDTARGDSLPLGATSIEELVGAGLAVLDEADEIVLQGVIGELMEGGCICCRDRYPEDPDDPAPPEEEPQEPDGDGGESFFEVGEPHDASFIRGDSNDDTSIDISDAIHILAFLFISGDAPYCLDAADASDDGQIDITDPIVVLQSLFQGGASIRSPFPAAGYDTTPDEFSCE